MSSRFEKSPMAFNGLIEGRCEPEFYPVRDAFHRHFQERKEIGASVAIYVEGEKVVDLWAGVVDKKGTPWEQDTISNVFSATKGISAVCVHRLVDQGLLELSRPIADYWPEFAENGKGNITLRDVLSHQAGVAAVKEILPGGVLYNPKAMAAAIAREAPWWKPGSKHGYHALTMGWILGELVYRVTGKSLGAYLQEEIAEPFGLDMFVGLPDQHDERSAAVIRKGLYGLDFNMVRFILEIGLRRQSVTAKAFTNPRTLMGSTNSSAWKKSEIPAANGQTNGRSLAKFYGILANGGALHGKQLLSPEAIARCMAEQSHGFDQVLRLNTRFSLGFMLSQEKGSGHFGPCSQSFGHPGAGGSMGFADPDRKLGFGYVMNRMSSRILVDPRSQELIKALYRCV